MRKNTYKNPYETASFGERAKYIREKRGLSIKDVARKIYVDPSTLCKWETGDNGYFVRAGCFFGTFDEFVDRVHQVHAVTKYEKEYELAVELAKVVLG